MTQERVNFGSKLGMVLATAGSAVGLGNVWRFPYMVGENGGAAFILIYIMCIMLLGIPCMMSEFIIGRHGAANTARAYSRMDTHKAWHIVGLMGVITGFLITGYYAVVSGWCLQYIFASGVGELRGDPQYIASYFADFSASPLRPVFWTVVVFLLTHVIIVRGVRGGIEKASKALMTITIGEDCWLGGNVVVCPGVTIGNRCIIAAGSVVTKDIPDDSLAAGVPAVVKRSLKK